MRKSKEKLKRDLATIGREVLAEEKQVVPVIGFEIGEAVQYFNDGWRYGHVIDLPDKGLNKGRARVEHPTGHRVWVDGAGLKKMETKA